MKYRKRKWAAGVIALSWLTHVKMTKARGELKRKRIKQLENFRKRAKVIKNILKNFFILFIFILIF